MKNKKGLRLTVVLALICSILVTAMPLASFAADDISTTQTAPASDCISTTLTVVPKMFFTPWADHWST